MKVLFLDIDSVLNCSRPAEDLYSDGPGAAAGPFVEPRVPLCRANVRELRRILEAVPGLTVVWSTDWRLYDDPEYGEFLNPRQWLEAQDWMKDRVVGKTPKKMSSTRYEEIRMWLSCEGRKAGVGEFAILDDYCSAEMCRYFGGRFFRCGHEKGLTPEIADGVIRLFREGGE